MIQAFQFWQFHCLPHLISSHLLILLHFLQFFGSSLTRKRCIVCQYRSPPTNEVSICIPVGNSTNKHFGLCLTLSYSLCMCDGGTISSLEPDRNKIGCSIWSIRSTVLHGERTRQFKILGPFESVPLINHFRKGNKTPAMSSTDVKVLSRINAETFSRLFLASAAPTAPH